jgi:hypothetical protein
VNRFFEHAQQILETATQAAGEDCRLFILVTSDGGVGMVSGSDWALDALRQHHGAQAAYRVTRRGTRVELEGCSGDLSCRLEAGPQYAGWAPGADFAQYQLA